MSKRISMLTSSVCRPIKKYNYDRNNYSFGNHQLFHLE